MNDNMIAYKPENVGEWTHIDVNNSNYFWGFPNLSEDEFEKEKQKVAMNLL